MFSIEKTAAPTSVILMSLQAVTHFMNTGNNRYLELEFEQQGNVVSATVPTDSLAALPGYYMLFVMVDDIPSVAEIVRISGNQETTSAENETVVGFNISMFPNPASSHVFVRGEGLRELELYTVNGKLLTRQSARGEMIRLAVEKYPAGTYLLKMRVKSQIIFRQLVKE